MIMRSPSFLLSKKYFILGAIFLVFFALFTVIAKLDLLTSFDFNTTVKMQNHTPHKLFYPLSLLSLLARFDVIFILLLIYAFFKKNLQSLLIIFLFGSAHIVEYIGKLMLDHPGPPFMFYKATETVYFPDLYVNGSSYPSGHALRAVFFAVLITFVLLQSKIKDIRKYSALFFLWTTVITLSVGKIILGQHWTSDVFGGILLGLSFGLLAVSFKQNTPRH